MPHPLELLPREAWDRPSEEIARETGYSWRTVHRWRQRLGMPDAPAPDMSGRGRPEGSTLPPEERTEARTVRLYERQWLDLEEAAGGQRGVHALLRAIVADNLARYTKK